MTIYYKSTKARGAHKARRYFVQGAQVKVIKEDGKIANSQYSLINSELDCQGFLGMIANGHMIQIDLAKEDAPL